MVVLRVFQPFPHHHCKIVSSGKNGHTYLTWSPNTSFWSPPLTSTRPEWRKNERKFSADASWRVLQLGVCLCVLKSTVPHVKNTDLLTLWQGTGVGGQKNKTVGTTSDRLHWRLWAFYFCRLTWKLTILFLQTHLETDFFLLQELIFLNITRTRSTTTYFFLLPESRSYRRLTTFWPRIHHTYHP
jgi:hypothetical protein